MFTLRCTQKLLRRGLVVPQAEPPAATNLLGDWYANLLICGRQQWVLCVSERTLLPVVVTAKDAKSLGPRLTAAASELLLALGVAPEAVQAEQGHMRDCTIGRTASRSVLGSLNDLMWQFEMGVREGPERSALAFSLWLAQTPCKPIEYASPDRATQALFNARQAIGEASQRAGRGASA